MKGTREKHSEEKWRCHFSRNFLVKSERNKKSIYNFVLAIVTFMIVIVVIYNDNVDIKYTNPPSPFNFARDKEIENKFFPLNYNVFCM